MEDDTPKEQQEQQEKEEKEEKEETDSSKDPSSPADVPPASLPDPANSSQGTAR